MASRLKAASKLLLPPIFVPATRRILQVFASKEMPIEWDIAEDTDEVWALGAGEGGWSHPSIAARQEAEWGSFLDAVSAPKPFLAWQEEIYQFGYVVGRARRGSVLSVLDWGGGLGHYFRYARELFPELSFDYTIKDLPQFCEIGRRLSPSVVFVTDDATAFKRRYELIFASSSAHYSRNIYGLIDRLGAAAEDWLMLTRMPTVLQHDDFVVVQRPHARGYLTEYPCWFVNRAKLIGRVEASGFTLAREFVLGEAPRVSGAPEQCAYRGFLFRRRS